MTTEPQVPESAEVQSFAMQAEIAILEAQQRAAEVLIDVMENAASDHTRLQAAVKVLQFGRSGVGPPSKDDPEPDARDEREKAKVKEPSDSWEDFRRDSTQGE